MAYINGKEVMFGAVINAVMRKSDGNIEVSLTPIADADATSKAYVDKLIAELTKRIDSMGSGSASAKVEDGNLIITGVTVDGENLKL